MAQVPMVPPAAKVIGWGLVSALCATLTYRRNYKKPEFEFMRRLTSSPMTPESKRWFENRYKDFITTHPDEAKSMRGARSILEAQWFMGLMGGIVGFSFGRAGILGMNFTGNIWANSGIGAVLFAPVLTQVFSAGWNLVFITESKLRTGNYQLVQYLRAEHDKVYKPSK